MRRIPILGLLLVAATVTGCVYPELKPGTGGTTASGGSVAGAAGSSSSSNGGSAAGTSGGGKGGSAGSSGAGAAGSSSSSKGGSDAGVRDAPGSQPDTPVGGTGGSDTSTTGGTSSTGGSGGSSSSGAGPDCLALTDPDNGSVSAPTTTRGSTAVYSCNTGYKLSGSKTRTCQADGTWNAAEPTCSLVDCGVLDDPAGGSVSAPTTTFGEQANYSCQTGYGLSGSATRACQADGTWSDSAPTCTLKDCGALADPVNGSVSASPTTYGSTANYTCQTGYLLSGTAMRTCQADGTWSDSAPTCPIVDCYVPAGTPYGRVNATSTIWGSIASYTCDPGYSITGTATRTCQADGIWSGTPPTCTLVDCGTAPNISNGTLLNPYATAYGATATFACNTGYYSSGFATTRTCQADGTWSLPSPVCSIKMLQLTVNKVGHGTGTVTSSDGAVSCGSTCAGAVASYPYGTIIYLSAGADTTTNQSFMGWIGGVCTGLGGCQFTITIDTTVTANFSPPPNIMFATSKTYTPNLGGLAGADTICNQLAGAAGLTGNYVAWLSTTNVSALSRLNGASGWVRPDGKPVLNSVDDLSKNRVFYPPRLDESGNDVGASPGVMTNTKPDGTGYVGSGFSSCSDFSSNIDNGTSLLFGIASYTDATLTMNYGVACSSQGRIYCLGVDRQAQVAVVPTQGRHAFMTLEPWSPGGGISSADALCQREATAAGLSGNYLALLPQMTSGYQYSAASRFSTSGQTWVRADGIAITQTAAAFFTTSFFDVPPNSSADGAYRFGAELAWTGAATPTSTATDATDCANWTSSSSSNSAVVGVAGETNTKSFFSSGTSSCDTTWMRITCLQQ